MPSANQNRRKRTPGLTLIRTFPVSKYLAVLFLSLNLHRLPNTICIFPGRNGPRALLMLWVVLLLFLAWAADHHAETERRRDAEEQEKKTAQQVLNLVSFLALAVPGLLILDIAAIIHLYFCWTSTPEASAVIPSPVPTVLMAAGCVFWIYGRTLPGLPFNSIWGIHIKTTSASPESWNSFHKKAAWLFLIVSAACLCIGTFL